jgi:hypothetical protein
MKYLSIQEMDQSIRVEYIGASNVDLDKHGLYTVLITQLPDSSYQVRFGYTSYLHYRTVQDMLKDWNINPRTIPSVSLVGILDEKLSDADFRQMVRNTLPITIGSNYTDRMRKIGDFLKHE